MQMRIKHLIDLANVNPYDLRSYMNDSSINSPIDPIALLCMIYVNILRILFFLCLATRSIMCKIFHISNNQFHMLVQNNENNCVGRNSGVLKQFLFIFSFIHQNRIPFFLILFFMFIYF